MSRPFFFLPGYIYNYIEEDSSPPPPLNELSLEAVARSSAEGSRGVNIQFIQMYFHSCICGLDSLTPRGIHYILYLPLYHDILLVLRRPGIAACAIFGTLAFNWPILPLGPLQTLIGIGG